MRKNLDRLGGLVHSQRVLIALTQKGVAREDAYRLVQRNAMQVWRGEGDFLTLLKADKDVRKHLSEAELEGNFRPRLSLQARRHDLQAGVWKRVVPQAIHGRRGRRIRQSQYGANTIKVTTPNTTPSTRTSISRQNHRYRNAVTGRSGLSH